MSIVATVLCIEINIVRIDDVGGISSVPFALCSHYHLLDKDIQSGGNVGPVSVSISEMEKKGLGMSRLVNNTIASEQHIFPTVKMEL